MRACAVSLCCTPSLHTRRSRTVTGKRWCAAGVLFRCYPGPYVVMRRYQDDLRVVHTQETMPTLKQVAVEILPNA